MRSHDDARHATSRALPAFLLAASTLGASALGGCSVGPKYTRPEAQVGQTWREHGDARIANQAGVDALWWKGFHDPTLDRLVDLARQQNPPLQIAGLRIMEARAQLGVVTGQQYPQTQAIFAEATAEGLSKKQANVLNFDRRFVNYQVGFDAVWELDFWGKYRRGVEAQAATLLASVADYYSALVSLTAEVARTYVVIRTFEVLIDETRENVRIQEQGLAIAQSRFKNGATSELDPVQATTLLESTRATIPQLETSLQQARNALGTLLGQPPGTVDGMLEGPHGIPQAPATVAVSVPADMLRRRPDVRSAELVAAAQCAQIGVAQADLYPSFTIFGTIGLRASTAAGAPGKFLSTDNVFYAFGPSINWPFLNYGRLQNAVRVQDARFQQLLVSYQNTVLKAVQEVEDALTGFVKSQEAVVAEQRAVTAAQRAVELALVQYREGAADYQRVLDAQRSLLAQQTNLTQSSSSVTTNVIAAFKALGGGWELRQGQPLVPERMQQEMKKRTDWGDLLSEPSGPEVKEISQPVKH